MWWDLCAVDHDELVNADIALFLSFYRQKPVKKELQWALFQDMC